MGLKEDHDLLSCKNKCLMTNGCTAFNFVKKDGKGCSLRACDSPPPKPSVDTYSPDNVGYYYEPGTLLLLPNHS